LKAQIPTLESFEDPTVDYPYRTIVDRTEWADAVETLAESIDYSNFKSAVAEMQGYERAGCTGGSGVRCSGCRSWSEQGGPQQRHSQLGHQRLRVDAA